MGTKLEEAFDLRPIAEAEADIVDVDDHDEEKEAEKNAVTPKEAIEHAAEIVTALTGAQRAWHEYGRQPLRARYGSCGNYA